MIRKIQKSDIDEIAGYISKALSSEFKMIGEGAYSFDEAKSDILHGIENGWIQFVFEKDRKNIGYISAMIEDGEGNIITLVVIEEYRRTGIGSTLFSDVLNEFKKTHTKKINLTIHYKNEIAMTFVKKFGFTERTIEFSKDS